MFQLEQADQSAVSVTANDNDFDKQYINSYFD